ncbi:hypothetical protein JD969_12765 [Planctomycetota bacterium]|nr:hypothetical protein JD969_12765 [Planctomycetota bacterium]
MRIAVPLKNGIFSRHFGKSDAVAIFDVNVETKRVTCQEIQSRNCDGCQGLPNWFAELNINRVLVAGLGQGALNGLLARNIDVSSAPRHDNPNDVINAYLADPTPKQPKVCAGHSHGHGHDHSCQH